MFTKRLLLAALALAAALPLLGCRHHCNKCSTTSSAPPCCGTSSGYLPPGAVTAPPPATINVP
jgi:hypothetical protein